MVNIDHLFLTDMIVQAVRFVVLLMLFFFKLSFGCMTVWGVGQFIFHSKIVIFKKLIRCNSLGAVNKICYFALPAHVSRKYFYVIVHNTDILPSLLPSWNGSRGVEMIDNSRNFVTWSLCTIYFYAQLFLQNSLRVLKSKG